MAVPEDIALAAHRGDVDTVRGFLDQHPESVDQPDVIDDLDAPMNLMQIAVRLALEPDTRGKTRDLVELLLSNVDVHAPDTLAEVLPPPTEGAAPPPVTRCARTGEGKATSPLKDAARNRTALRAVVSERIVLESDCVLEPSLLIE